MSEQIPAPGRGRPAPMVATRRQRTMLTFGGLAGLFLAIWLFADILTPFVLAGGIAYFLDPLASRMTRLGMPRGLAAILLVVMLVLLTLLSLLLLYPLVVAQMAVLIAALPGYVTSITATLRELLDTLEQATGPDVMGAQLRDLILGQASAMLSWLGTATTRLIGGGIALFNVFTFTIVTPVMSFYLLRDWPDMMARLESWMPRRSAATLRQIFRDIDRVLSAWLRGQLLCCLILGIYYAAALSAIGLDLGLTLGLMAGFLSFIPYVGSMTGLILAVLLAVGQWGDWNGVLWVLAIFLTGQAVEGYIIYPRLLGDRVHLHAVWVIFALFAGGVAFGFLGVLLAVPIAAALGVLARYWLRRYLESPLYLDPPRTGM